MDRSLPFRFTVVTAFRSDTRGTVVAGSVEQGDVTMGARLRVEGRDRSSPLTGLSGLRQPGGQPSLVALELPELEPDDVSEGDVLVVDV